MMTTARIAPLGDRAVVIGASMAGLLAARVLSAAFEQVTLVDHDVLPADAVPRRCVPQGRHIHALIARGQQVLDELVPGLTDELVGAGAPLLDQLNDARLYFSGHRLRQGVSGLTVVSASRPLLEAMLRGRLRAVPGLRFLESCDALGLSTTPDRRRVTGVRALRRADGSVEETLDADLVIDASGRSSRLPVWLESLGYPRPVEEKVHVGVVYASRLYRLPTGALEREQAVIDAPFPGNPRGAGLAMIENGRCIVTLIGMLGEVPPTDPAGYLDFARSLRHPDVYEAIVNGDPLDDPVQFRFPSSVRRRYERLRRFPDGLLAVGDAVCSLNPIYGQGMSVAAIEALTLRRHLERGIPQPRRFLRDLSRVIDVAWDMSTGGDLAFPAAQGRRTLKTRMGAAYIPRLHATAAHDSSLGTAFLRVAGLVDPPRAIMRPDVILRVLRG